MDNTAIVPENIENLNDATPPAPTPIPSPKLTQTSFQLLKSLDIQTIIHFAPSANGQFIAFSDFPNSAKVYDLASGVVLNELTSPLASFVVEGDVAFLANDTLLATQFITDVVTGTLGSIYIWDWVSEEITARFNVNVSPGYHYPCYVKDFEISQNSDSLAILDCEGIEIWDIHSKVLLRTMEQTDATDIAFSNSGNWLASAQVVIGKSPVQIWDLNDCNTACTLKFELFPPDSGQEDWIEATKVLFHDDILAAIIDGRLRLWDFEEEKEITWPQAVLIDPIAKIAFSSKGVLATLTEDGLLALFDSVSGTKLGEQQIPGAIEVRFSSDGTTLVIGGDLSLQIWEIPQN